MNTICLYCVSKLNGANRKFCNNKCQSEYNYNRYVASWRSGEVSGNRGVSSLALSAHIVKYIKNKYNNKCNRCSWAMLNPITNTSPLEIDHIDGDSNNNREENLVLLCPNCHSLTFTYKNLNRGHGRAWRMKKYDKIVHVPL